MRYSGNNNLIETNNISKTVVLYKHRCRLMAERLMTVFTSIQTLFSSNDRRILNALNLLKVSIEDVNSYMTKLINFDRDLAKRVLHVVFFNQGRNGRF